MNNTSNPTPPQPQGEENPDATVNPTASPHSAHCRLEPLCSALNDGAHRAKAAAEKAIPKVKAAVFGATYWLGYGVSFATVFSYILVKELAPETLKAGCRAGGAAGQKTAEDLASRLGTRREGPAPEAEPSGPAAQPGVV